jgi:hypothetical protein
MFGVNDLLARYRVHADTAAEIIATQVAKERLELDDEGHPIGVHGLRLRATRHHFEHAGQIHHA